MAKALVALIFVCLYLSGDVLRLAHTIVNHTGHGKRVCTIEDERNACHLQMVHADAERGCGHMFHFSEKAEKCPICDTIFVKIVFDFKNNEYFCSPLVENYYFLYGSQISANPLRTAITLRGPPVIS